MLFISAIVSAGFQHLGLQPLHAAVQPHHRRLAHGDVQIAGPFLDHCLQQLVDENLIGHETFIPPRRSLLYSPLASNKLAAV